MENQIQTERENDRPFSFLNRISRERRYQSECETGRGSVFVFLNLQLTGGCSLLLDFLWK